MTHILFLTALIVLFLFVIVTPLVKRFDPVRLAVWGTVLYVAVFEVCLVFNCLIK